VLVHEPLLPVARRDRLADGQRAQGPRQMRVMGELGFIFFKKFRSNFTLDRRP
jgi:hypothetical protein